MSAVEQVTVTVDGREVEVAKGTGLVETAAAAGIEIPVFCYEPRLGPPVGACRMCLVEIEGMPKLQAGCTLTAQDGMVVRTARSSAKAAEGQEATLEFILVNHPLDCPVCDKGGECPLQDLTFKYGPGSTRMTFPKRTFDKPIPISPTIALDRERCILCYRCTRFSAEVAEDGQLVARNRGAQSLITTFEDEAYRAPFSGNVIELCPVGALTSTQYRFEARPWEIQNVPTVCGLCPVGCNISATTREGKVKRVISRNHPEVDQGWLCDKGRFAFPYLYAGDRILDPLERVRLRGFSELSWDDALDRAEALLRASQGRIVTALSGSETVEQAYALAKLLRQGLGANSAVLPEATSFALDAFRAPLSSIAAAEIVVVIGDEEVADRAPIVDLWLKQARRNGAEVVRVAEPKLGEKLEQRVAGSDRAVLIWSGRAGGGGARLAELGHRLGLDGKPGCAAFNLPSTPNARGVADAWAAAAEGDEENPEPIGLLIVSGDEAASDPAVRALAEQAEHVIAITMFHGLAVGWADLVLPGTSYLERDGSYLNLEGRLQRLRRSVIPPVPDEIAWLAKLAERFGVELSPHPSVVFAELSELIYGGMAFGAVGERAPLPEPDSIRGSVAGSGRARSAPRRSAGRALPRPAEAAALPATLRRTGRRAGARARLPAAGARDRACVRRRRAPPDRERRRRQRSLERDVGCPAGQGQPRAHCRHCADRRGVRGGPSPRGRGGQGMTEPWWVSVIKSVIIINLVMGAFAYLTLAERKVMGRMQLRYGPNRAGPFGLLQPIADLMKLVRKESFFPGSAVDTLYILSPFVAAFTALSTFAVIPFGPGWEIFGVQVDGQISDVPIALILIFAIGSIGIYGFIVGGWASDSKYALLGSMRTCAQLVSYEVSLALSVLGVVIMAQSLSLTEIVTAQDSWWYIAPQFVGFVVFMFAGTAETARAPFDLPEAEQELVAGYHTEYGGMRFGLFTMSEYVNLITLSGLAVTLFLGGWHFPVLEGLGPLWFVLKLFALLFIFIWMRTTLPRLRYDQLMRFGWKVLLPVATINAVVTAVLVVWL